MAQSVTTHRQGRRLRASGDGNARGDLYARETMAWACVLDPAFLVHDIFCVDNMYSLIQVWGIEWLNTKDAQHADRLHPLD